MKTDNPFVFPVLQKDVQEIYTSKSGLGYGNQIEKVVYRSVPNKDLGVAIFSAIRSNQQI